jgi:hypothetical protein
MAQTETFTSETLGWAVPAGVTSLTISATGGGGGGWKTTNNSASGNGGGGGIVTDTFTVTPGELLNIYIGGGGSYGTGSALGGINGGGGVSSFSPNNGGDGVKSGGGGAATLVTTNNNNTALLVAGGGGGSGVLSGGYGGGNATFNGGNGDGINGGTGGGTGPAGGLPLGNGGTNALDVLGGGGGGGWAGGSSGTGHDGGGGGSSFSANSTAIYSYVSTPYQGTNALAGQGGGFLTTTVYGGRNGQVTITYTSSNTPTPPTPTPPTPTPAISNICFPAGTPIKTDQGIVNIENLSKQVNTIKGQAILGITKTVTLDKYLIRFKPHALERNCPNKTTIMTKDHLIAFKGQMVPAYRFLDYSEEVKKVQYKGETLYNVLLAKHSLMDVNNLQCETLHPENIIAKIYMSQFSEEEKNDVICLMNKALVTRDLETYKRITTTF